MEEKDNAKKIQLLADLLSHKLITQEEFEIQSKAYAALSEEKKETKSEGRSPSISAPETVKIYRASTEIKPDSIKSKALSAIIADYGDELGYLSEFLSLEESFSDDRLKALIVVLQEKNHLNRVAAEILQCEFKTLSHFSIMREETLGINLLKCFWFNFSGHNYLEEIIKPFVKEIIKTTKTKSLECDPSRIDSAQAQKNLPKLLELIRKFLANFFESWALFPPEFEALLKIFYNSLTEAEGAKKMHLGLGYSEKALTLFGGFLLLRFICPAIVSPVKYKLASEDLPPNAQRALILTSKILQSIGNQVEFEEKENYLQGANDFVRDHMAKMYAFVSTLMDEEKKTEKRSSISNSNSLKKKDKTILDMLTRTFSSSKEKDKDKDNKT